MCNESCSLCSLRLSLDYFLKHSAWEILGENESQVNKRSEAVVNMNSLGFETVTLGVASASRYWARGIQPNNSMWDWYDMKVSNHDRILI